MKIIDQMIRGGQRLTSCDEYHYHPAMVKSADDIDATLILIEQSSFNFVPCTHELNLTAGLVLDGHGQSYNVHLSTACYELRQNFQLQQ